MEGKKRADSYIDVMGHDINNLNQVILANLELLQLTNRLEEEQNRFLEDAILATRDSAKIVENVKAIQRIYEERPEARDLDLDELLRDCIGQLPRPAGKNVIIRYKPGKGIIIKALPELKLAFCNVLGNAIKYSDNSVNIDVCVNETTIEDERKYFVTTIADDSHGIPYCIKQALFSPSGEDEDAATTVIPPGLGFGLFTAKALAEAFGGSLNVEDRVPGDYSQGTKVIITLPAAEGGVK